MEKQETQPHSLKDLSLVAWRADNRRDHTHVREVHKALSDRPRLRADAPTVN